ncbi:MAG: DUF4344 domain-containing metallopeptidase [Candidatus Nitrosocaldus sp.]
MLMRKEEHMPILFALAAVAIALGITNILLVYNITTEMNQYESIWDVNKSNIHAALDDLEKRYDAIDKKVENVDSKLLELKGMSEVLNDVRYKLVNIHSKDGNASSNSSSNDMLKHMLNHSLEQRLDKGLEGKEEDRGDFKIIYMDNDRYSSVKSMLSRSKMLDAYVNTLNSKFILPHDISIVVDEDGRCKSASGYYEQVMKRIVLCYSSIDNFMRLYPEDIERFSTLVKFLLYHEVAHALIDVYKLPIVGMQEYAADNFAIVMMLNDGDDIHPLIWLYDAMREDKHATSTTSSRYWDTHMLFVQRYYDILCLAYGSDPSRYDSGDLPSERAYRCFHEYSSALNAWDELLKPWMRVG